MSAIWPAVTVSVLGRALLPTAPSISTLLLAPPLALIVSALAVLSLLIAPTTVMALVLPLADKVASAPTVSVPL